MEESTKKKEVVEEVEPSPTVEAPGTPSSSKADHKKSDKKKHKHSRAKSFAKQLPLDQAGQGDRSSKEDKMLLFTPRPKKPSKGDDEKIIEFNYFSSEPQYVISEMILRQAVDNEITFIDVLRKLHNSLSAFTLNTHNSIRNDWNNFHFFLFLLFISYYLLISTDLTTHYFVLILITTFSFQKTKSTNTSAIRCWRNSAKTARRTSTQSSTTLTFFGPRPRKS